MLFSRAVQMSHRQEREEAREYADISGKPGHDIRILGCHGSGQLVLVNHVVPTVGFLLRERAQTLLHGWDTYRTDTLSGRWPRM
jgi:hypothetical protein